MARAKTRRWMMALSGMLGLAGGAGAETGAPTAELSAVDALASWVAVPAPIGHEEFAAPYLNESLNGSLNRSLNEPLSDRWRLDDRGNFVLSTGAGGPQRVVACAFDTPAYAVSQITEDGYLRLHRIGAGSAHPLWDQAHEGQQVRILSDTGPHLGVTAVANGHFAFQHRRETALTTADDLWVDVGVESRAAVEAMGIRLTDPVIRHLPPWSFADVVAGPSAGARAGCAALVALAESGLVPGRTTWLLSAQSGFGWNGLVGSVARLGAVDEVVVIATGATETREGFTTGRAATIAQQVFEQAGVSKQTLLTPIVSDPGALMERITLASATTLRRELMTALGLGETVSLDWLALETGSVEDLPPRSKSPQEALVATLDHLAEVPGLSGNEGLVREQILQRLPPWAQARAQTDAAGNLWVELGDGKDVTVFMAHMDEVGYAVAGIEEDGTVQLERRGGAVRSAWEGQPARLQLSGSRENALRGVFQTRSAPETKATPEVTAWFGMNRQALLAAGVTEGLGVLGWKRGYRIGPQRYTSRALDDRAGSTALLEALRAINPEQFEQNVIFAWSVQEEVGLNGAAALAENFGTRTRRIYSVDTFVSSDTPLESPHFALAPLGAGPVLRSVENSSVVRRADLDRNLRIAAAAGIDVQVGHTQGGTDGTTFTWRGAPNAGLSWPGRYSHSPAEVLDLRDLAALVDLIVAMAEAADR